MISIFHDAMRRIHGDIPNVMLGSVLFGQYDWDMISMAGSSGTTSPAWNWNSHKITNRSFGTFGFSIQIPEYVLEKISDDNYTLREINNGRFAALREYHYRYSEWEDNHALGTQVNMGFTYRTINIDSSKIVPTDKETRPANIAVRFYIRAK